MSDVLFKKGSNGPYAKCNIILCPFWAGRPSKIANHIMKVHGRSKDECAKIVKEYLNFFLDNGGDPDSIEVFSSDFEINDNWESLGSKAVDNALEILNDNELEE